MARALREGQMQSNGLSLQDALEGRAAAKQEQQQQQQQQCYYYCCHYCY